MYLKSLEIHGFKSFANKIVFDFHNGITGIVGPNGSGKSNVADAVRWVLGEQSAKQLRGSSMQDVIFAGTENRKPLSYAYVAITLDNSDHQLATSYEEVTVARRVYRSGESEYLLNGSVCRLKEITELFYDTGIGKEGYSIIGQGQIDRILSGKPEERRELFDEAAGIVKYKKRKNAAQKKLDSERENLIRVSDILSELERQVGPLGHQAEKARVYLRKREELKRYDVNLFLLESRRIRAELEEARKAHEIASDSMAFAEARYQQIQEKNERIQQQLTAFDEAIEELRQNISEASEEALRSAGRIELLREQIHTAEISRSHYAARVEAIEQDILLHEAQKASTAEEEEKIKAEALVLLEKETRAETTLAEVHERIEKLSSRIEAGRQELVHLLEKSASIKGRQQRFDAMLEQLNIRKSKLSQRLVASQSQEEDYMAALEDALAEEKQIQEEIRKIRAREVVVLGKAIEWKEKLRDNTQKIEAANTQFHQVSSRLESRHNIAERYEGYGNSIRRVMELKKENSGLVGVVSDLIHVERRYETAIETALGGSIQNIVTEEEDTAKRMITYLKANRYGRATFLPLTAMKPRSNPKNAEALKEPGVIGIASDLVSCDAKYRNLAAYLLGRILIVDNLDHAAALARRYHYALHMVTLDGELLSPGGSMTGGAFKNTSNLLGRNREIEELTSQLEQIKKELAGLKSRREDIVTAQELCEDELEELREELQEKNLLLNTAQMNVEHARADKEEKENLYADLKRESREIEKEAAEIAEGKLEIQEEVKTSHLRKKEIEAAIEEDKKQLDLLREEERIAQEKLQQLQLSLAELQKALQYVQQNASRIEEEAVKLTEERTAVFEENEGSGSLIAEREQEIRSIEENIALSKVSAEAREQRLHELLEGKEQASGEYRSLFKEQETVSDEKNLLDKELFRLQSRIEKLEEDDNHLISYMWEEYELTPHAALALREETLGELPEIKKQVASIKDEIKKLGNVNVNAIEEYREVAERYEFMKAQHDDLIQAEKTLLDAITDLDNGMRRQFMEKFADIQREFDASFKQLFGGGHGTLELVEGEDVLECGIRIIAQPPGKKLQNMMQLSGGEKALTAIALLFAIQALKPSPFCLLDEIEAALDDSNVDRYAGYLNRLTENTQFIVITHRRGTMVAADRLYGITMQEKGVSTLVSVNLIDEELED